MRCHSARSQEPLSLSHATSTRAFRMEAPCAASQTGSLRCHAYSFAVANAPAKTWLTGLPDVTPAPAGITNTAALLRPGFLNEALPVIGGACLVMRLRLKSC